MKTNTEQNGKKPLVYIIPFSAAYALPIIFILIATVITSIARGGYIAAFPGLFIVGVMLYSPFYGIYYAVLTFVHAVTDMILPPCRRLKNAFLTIISALIPSALLIAGCLTLMLSDFENPEFDFGIVFMIMGFALLPVGFLRYIIPDSEKIN